jgi:hypothetical protein
MLKLPTAKESFDCHPIQKQRGVTIERAALNPDWALGVDVEPLQDRTAVATIDSALQG